MTTDRNRAWEEMGAASGLLATLLFVIAFIVFVVNSPTGDPSFSNVDHAQSASAWITNHLSQYRVVVLLSMLGVTLSLWFLGSLWATLRQAEGELGRGSTLALVGGIGGSVLILAGLVVSATIGLSTSAGQATAVPTLYTEAALFTAIGAGVLSLFFFGVGKAILHTGMLGRWLGVLGYIPGLLALCGFMTPFFADNALNAATGALGRWAWSVAFLIWLFLASGAMWLAQRRRRERRETAAGPARPTHATTGAEG